MEVEDVGTILRVANTDPLLLTNMDIFAGHSTMYTTSVTVNSASATLRDIVFHSGGAHHNLHQCLEESWGEWGECDWPCGVGTKTRTGRIRGRDQTQTLPCNTHLCPLNLPYPECNCENDRGLCRGDCDAGLTCHEVPAGNQFDYQCLPDDLGICSYYGQAHLTTFDGATNDIYRAAGSVGDPLSGSVFTLVKSTQAFEDQNGYSFKLSLTTKGYPALELTVAGGFGSYTVTTFAYVDSDFDFSQLNEVENEAEFKKYINFQIREKDRGDIVSYQTPFGLKVTQDDLDFQVQLSLALSGRLSQNVEGLCGNYDQDISNDYTCTDGTVFDAGQTETELNDAMFEAIKCWNEEPDNAVTNPNDNEECTDEQRREDCETLFDGEAFKHCLTLVDPAPLIKNCLYDWCVLEERTGRTQNREEFIRRCRLIDPDPVEPTDPQVSF